MITCSRCGKENQDLYKFCLGCGAKLQANAAPAAGKPASPAEDMPATPPPDRLSQAPAVAKTAVSTDADDPGLGERSMDAAADMVTPPVGLEGPATPLPNAASAMGAVASVTAVPTSAPSVQIGIGSAPMQVPLRAAPASGPAQPFGASPAGARPVITSVPSTSVPTAPVAHASPFSPPPSDTVTCPACGKQVASAFAFCGGCGHRMKPAPGAVGDAAVRRPDAAVPAAVKMGPRGHLTLIRPDGTEGGVFPLQGGESVIGRGQGALFDADPYLSPRHAVFALSDAGLEVRDQRSLNGLFVRIGDEEALESGDSFRIGQELLRFDAINPPTPLEDGTEIIGTPNPGYWGRLSVVVGRDLDGPAFPLFEEAVRLGRERGDILFPEDGYVSGAHCQLSIREGRVYLKDVGSSNGTYLRVRESRKVASGSLMLMGQQLFRVAYK